MKRIKKFFTENIALKIMSVVFSIILWTISVNVNNPISSRTYTVNLSVVGEGSLENGYEVYNKQELESKIITLTLSSDRNKLDYISRNKDLIDVYIDIKDINIDEVQAGENIPLNIEHNIGVDNVRVVDYYPRVEEVILDKMISKTIPIEVRLEGELPEQYAIKSVPTIEPAQVKVKGYTEDIEDIEKIYTVIDVSTIKQDTKVINNIIVEDYSNNIITDRFEMDTDTVEVSVNLETLAKLPILPSDIVNIPNDYEVATVTTSVDEISLYADEDFLNKYEALKLPEVDISNTTSLTYMESFDIKEILQRNGATLAENEPESIVVAIKLKHK